MDAGPVTPGPFPFSNPVVKLVAMRTLDRCTVLALAASIAAAQPTFAQDTVRVPQTPPAPAAPVPQPGQLIQGQGPRTHTVVRGDNLWDLSQTYLGNAFLWPEIYRLNRDVVEDPHWIYPGEILRLPGFDDQVVPVAELPARTDIDTLAAPALPAQQPPSNMPVEPGSATVFTRRYVAPPTGPSVSGGPTDPNATVNVNVPPTVRWGEVLAAPYVDREGGPRAFGRILKSADLTGVAEASERFRFQAYDKIYISPPVGYVAPEGERYLAYKLGPVVHDQGQIVIPTGIIEVTQAARSGTAATGKVVRSFSAVSAEDRLIPIDTAGIGTTVRPVRVDSGPTTTIRWIYGEPVLPSVGAFVVLGVSSRNGVRMGDEFTLYKPSPRARRGEPRDPEILISKMQVVRSTPYGVTAVIIGQQQPSIQEGMPARITAKMP
jgi:hypothetical protein